MADPTADRDEPAGGAPPLDELWVYLSGSPLLSLLMTLGCYLAAVALFERGGRHPLLNPVLVSVAVLVASLQLSGLDYADYFAGAQFVHFLLGPATVALAVPLYRELPTLRRRALPIAVALAAGFLTTLGSTLLIARLAGLEPILQRSIAPKAITAPVAMGVAERIGGLPTMTAVFAVLTGVTGAVVAVPLLARLRVVDDAAKGLAIGLVSHGIGTARAFAISERAGAYAGLAMALSATVSAFVLPWIVSLVVR